MHQTAQKESGKMSWQEYVDDHLMCELPNGGTLKSAAIVGLDGGVWAQSPEFPALGDDEVNKEALPARSQLHLCIRDDVNRSFFFKEVDDS